MKKEKIKQRLQDKFKNKFDLSLIQDTTKETKYIDLICPSHGKLKVAFPNILYSKYGCPKCACENAHKKQQKTTEQFIEESKKIWKNTYTYKFTHYQNNNTKVIITCPDHGNFFARPSDFIRGHGCPKCANEKTKIFNSTTKKDSLQNFIEKAKKVHGDEYDYSKVNYINNDTKIKIICPIHGIFEQTPTNHLKGHGCPFCKKSKGENLISNILKELDISFESQYKIDLNSKKLFVDFKINNSHFIEFHGIQHFTYTKHFGDLNRFENQILRDYELRWYCQENNINLLEIPYFWTKEKIKNKILKFLNIC